MGEIFIFLGLDEKFEANHICVINVRVRDRKIL